MKVKFSWKKKLLALVLVTAFIAPMLMAFAPMGLSSHELSTAPIGLEGLRLEAGGIFEAIDWPTVITALLAPNAFGIPIMLLVIGFTYALGQWFGIHGKWQFLSALILGLIFGGGYQAVMAPLGYTLQAWFMYVVYGLLQGLIASLLYDSAKDLISKIVGKLIGATVFEVGLDETEENPF